MINAFNYLNVPGATTTLVKASGGILHSVVVNQATATGTVIMYDNASVTGTTPQIATVTSGTVGTYVYDIDFNNGLVVVNSSSPSVIITYR